MEETESGLVQTLGDDWYLGMLAIKTHMGPLLAGAVVAFGLVKYLADASKQNSKYRWKEEVESMMT
jgi:hypothetical protein